MKSDFCYQKVRCGPVPCHHHQYLQLEEVFIVSSFEQQTVTFCSQKQCPLQYSRPPSFSKPNRVHSKRQETKTSPVYNCIPFSHFQHCSADSSSELALFEVRVNESLSTPPSPPKFISDAFHFLLFSQIVKRTCMLFISHCCCSKLTGWPEMAGELYTYFLFRCRHRNHTSHTQKCCRTKSVCV